MSNIDTTIIQIAREANHLLKVLQFELDSTKNPHRTAVRALGLERAGWISKPHSEEAFRIWGDYQRSNPDDLETLHHLAIMHHARAIDLEAGSNPKESDTDWQLALTYWLKLWSSDAFWQGITEKACKGRKSDAVAEVRKNLPMQLLRIHFDIAFDETIRKERPYRSTYHMALAQRAAVSKEQLMAVQREVYTQCTRAVPDAAWRSGELNPDVIEEGAEVILRFLCLVPDCIPALEDAIRLQVRMINAWYTDFQAADAKHKPKLISKIQKISKKWLPPFERLVQLRDQADESARIGLCYWHRVMAEIYWEIDIKEPVEKIYELGVQAGIEGDDERMRCIRGLGKVRAYNAREKAKAKAADARACCDKLRKSDGLHLEGHLLLADAYAILEELELSWLMCQCGLDIKLDNIDQLNIKVAQDTRTNLENFANFINQRRLESKIKPHLDAAQKHMKIQAFALAIQELDTALQINPKSVQALFWRCESLVQEMRVREAREDLERFRSLVSGIDGSLANLQTAKDFEQQQLQPMEALVDKYGIEGARYRQQAIICFNNNQFEEAIRLFKSAVYNSKTAGVADINKELAVALNSLANKIVGDIMKSKKYIDRSDLESVTDASRLLKSATELSPGDKAIKENFVAVIKILAQLV